jgi:hypothetical protein
MLQAVVLCFSLIGISSSFAEPFKCLRLDIFSQALPASDVKESLFGASPKRAAPDNPAPKVKPYVSRVVKEGSTIVLKGEAPSEEDKKTIQGVIAATFPKATFVDKAKLNKHVPNRDTWLAGMNFALRQLAKLEEGSAVIRDNEISFEGAAKNEQDFKLLQQKLHEEVPNGMVLRSTALKPPSVSPFVWLAQLHSGSVNLSGHVPLESDRDLIIYARSLFGTLQVSNSMSWALGAPKGWVEAAKLSLNMLNLLQQGTVILTDKLITVDGVLAVSHTPDQVKAFVKLLPEGFKLEFNVAEASQASDSASQPEEVAVAAKRSLSNIIP